MNQLDLVDHGTGEVLSIHPAGRPAAPGDWRATSLALPEDLSIGDWRSLGVMLLRLMYATSWWWGDWWAFGDRKYGEAAAEAEPTGYALQTLQDAAWVCSRIESSRRREDLPFSHHREVAPLSPGEQDDWLALAAVNNWSQKELRAAIRTKRVATAREDMAQPALFPAGTFGVLYADPPWAYSNSGLAQSAETQYPTLDVDAICDFTDDRGRSVLSLAHDASVLFLWATSPLLPEAMRVMEAWCFQYKTSLIWKKDRAPGIGWWTRTYHELLLVGTRPETPQPAIKPVSIIEAPVTGHSAKPDAFVAVVQEMFPGPTDGQFYLELFARAPRKGWSVFGNQAGG